MDFCVSGAGAVAGVAALYKLVRPYFPVQVNCHFCNRNFKVPYQDQNGWICPDCDQYNGWNEDGDYNKILDISSQNKTRFIQSQTNSPSDYSNGLCKSCNLNQELKISQLAKFPHEGAKLEEYRDHLEQVYRLCPICEDHLASRLADQDRSLAGKLLEWRLENSRLNSSRDHGKRAMPRANKLLLGVSLFLFSLFQTFSPLSIPGCFMNIVSDKMNAIVIKFFHYSPYPSINVSQMITDLWLPSVVSLAVAMLLVSTKQRLYSLLVTNCLLLAMLILEPPYKNGLQLLFSGIGVLISAINSNKLHHSKSRKTKKVDTINGSKLTQPPILKHQDSREETKTHDLLSSSGSDLDSPVSLISGINKPHQPQSQLFSPQNKPGLLRSSNELSFNHEFATVVSDDDRDCDLSSLSLGDYRTSSPAPSVTSPFSLRSYSPSPSSNSLFSPKPRSRPLIQPARLTSTSWVAGGYWQPPVTSPGPTMSRSSSQSSGFISGAPSVASYNLNYNNIRTPTPTHSVVSDAYNPGHPFPPSVTSVRLRRKTVEESISDVSYPGEQKHKIKNVKCEREKPEGWTMTVTITPTGMLLTFSIIVNVGLAFSWITSSS